MRPLPLLFAVATLFACSSASSTDQGTDDATSDVGSDTNVGDTSVPDSTRDTTPSETPFDTAPFDTGPVDTTPMDTNTDGGSCGGGAACDVGLTCCGAACRNTNNDPSNCGTCGTVCSGTTSMCLGGHCSTPVCAPSCDTGTICCEIDGPGPTHFACIAGTACPIGCPACK